MRRIHSTPDLSKYERLAAEIDPSFVDGTDTHEPIRRVPFGLHTSRFISPRLRRRLPVGRLASIQAKRERQEAAMAIDVASLHDEVERRSDVGLERHLELLHSLAEQAIQHA